MGKNKKNSLKAIFFDLDGTLVDSEPIAYAAADKLLKEYEKSHNQEDKRWIVGRSWPEIYQNVYRPKELPLNKGQFTGKVNTIYNRLLKDNLPVIPGAQDCVRRLSKYYRLAIVSGSDRSQIEFISALLDLTDCFEFYLGNEDYHYSKPAADPYLMALKKSGLKPEQCLVVEDSLAGITAAKAAKIKVIAVGKANVTGQNLSEADAVINDLTELTDQLLTELF